MSYAVYIIIGEPFAVIAFMLLAWSFTLPERTKIKRRNGDIVDVTPQRDTRVLAAVLLIPFISLLVLGALV
jgi:hypothetical protein